jgi:hypothetical protein
VSTATAELLGQVRLPDGSPEFSLTPRGEVELKGKGVWRTWWLDLPYEAAALAAMCSEVGACRRDREQFQASSTAGTYSSCST